MAAVRRVRQPARLQQAYDPCKHNLSCCAQPCRQFKYLAFLVLLIAAGVHNCKGEPESVIQNALNNHASSEGPAQTHVSTGRTKLQHKLTSSASQVDKGGEPIPLASVQFHDHSSARATKNHAGTGELSLSGVHLEFMTEIVADPANLNKANHAVDILGANTTPQQPGLQRQQQVTTTNQHWGTEPAMSFGEMELHVADKSAVPRAEHVPATSGKGGHAGPGVQHSSGQGEYYGNNKQHKFGITLPPASANSVVDTVGSSLHPVMPTLPFTTDGSSQASMPTSLAMQPSGIAPRRLSNPTLAMRSSSSAAAAAPSRHLSTRYLATIYRQNCKSNQHT